MSTNSRFFLIAKKRCVRWYFNMNSFKDNFNTHEVIILLQQQTLQYSVYSSALFAIF